MSLSASARPSASAPGPPCNQREASSPGPSGQARRLRSGRCPMNCTDDQPRGGERQRSGYEGWTRVIGPTFIIEARLARLQRCELLACG